MNAPLRRVAVAAFVLFGLLIANANYVQVFQADELRSDPGNTRVLLDEYSRQRGSIVVDPGQSIAESEATDDKLKFLRTYPGKEVYAPATGFYSLIYGATGIEQAENDVLTGNDSRLFTRRLSDLLTGRDPKGGNVVLTLSRAAQRTAFQQLGNRRGAVVALDPRTGAILALASSPSFDPNPLASHDPEEIRATYEELSNDPDEPMLNRPISQTYPPGSTFKVIVSAAALQSGLNPDSMIDSPPAYRLPQSTRVLRNFGGSTCGANQITLEQALTISCNTAFAKLGVDLGEAAIRRQAAAFGVNDEQFATPLRVAASSLGEIPDDAALAQSSIGQRDVRFTAMQNAMIAAAIANDGVLMKPNLVKQLQAPDLSTLDEATPEQMSVAVPPEVAADLTRMMESVVERGSGTSAQIPGVAVAGKTGTAENVPDRPPHAWFIGFAPADNPEVAVAVLIENGGNSGSETTGGRVAAPVAKAVMQAVLGNGGG
jgi:penicillin-binding protein A